MSLTDEYHLPYLAITMNISANLLGLGNAATPLGIEAMKELNKLNQNKTIASKHMILFVVLNTASIQILPTTIAALRLQNGSKSPFDIIPAVLFTSFFSLLMGLSAARIFEFFREKRERNGRC